MEVKQANRLGAAAASPSFILLCALLAWSIVRQMLSAPSWGHGSFEMTEWLISYSGGFVRRGLPGTLAGIISDATGWQANHIVIAASLLFYLVLLLWLLRRASDTFPPVLILSCVAMGIPAYQDSIVRKDCMGLLFLLACLSVEKLRAPRAVRLALLNLIAGAAILSHEAFVFHSLAGFVLLGQRGESGAWLKGAAARCLALAPAGAVFILTAVFHGTPAQALAVNESWIPLWRSIDPTIAESAEPAAAIAALGWTTQQGLHLSVHMLTSGFYQPLAWAFVFAVSFLLVTWFAGRDAPPDSDMRNRPRESFVAIFLIQLLCISPLFLLGVDYGRWLFLWVVSSMILHTSGRAAPAWVATRVSGLMKASGFTALSQRLPAKDGYLLFFGVPVCWNLHNFLTASPISRHVDIIRFWF